MLFKKKNIFIVLGVLCLQNNPVAKALPYNMKYGLLPKRQDMGEGNSTKDMDKTLLQGFMFDQMIRNDWGMRILLPPTCVSVDNMVMGCNTTLKTTLPLEDKSHTSLDRSPPLSY
ncbi:hypothetical protein [Swingsia samuiensis]|uniref:Uncharacterized protein n=1 Tax=Swingsia samuiensis TaxID=1293412 RepID=A0A4Y6UH71_9PROT|nr:hypothetical protein [Swingsia samuiensis]QDH16923.1 hypothetical protein E3D00_04595 [Swingsia samuiensis]